MSNVQPQDVLEKLWTQSYGAGQWSRGQGGRDEQWGIEDF